MLRNVHLFAVGSDALGNCSHVLDYGANSCPIGGLQSEEAGKRCGLLPLVRFTEVRAGSAAAWRLGVAGTEACWRVFGDRSCAVIV